MQMRGEKGEEKRVSTTLFEVEGAGEDCIWGDCGVPRPRRWSLTCSIGRTRARTLFGDDGHSAAFARVLEQARKEGSLQEAARSYL